ncbi:hypothetical protein HPP92_011412 [Vanilla planifolia]|uniref:Pentatricopeptide repeat-containing protein n=1 Tax=Vanilla planifolia TaxID=51239 RepID=A0A835R1T8_VANPL|nr:hypothetical protein HPP92_011412 [Vanilla planifolia]
MAATTAAAGTVESYVSQIEHCIASKDLKLGRILHSCLLKTAFTLNTLLSNRLIDLYGKCGSPSCSRAAFDDLPSKNHQSWNTLLAAHLRYPALLSSARHLFEEMPERNLVSYNTMISKLCQHGFYQEALKTFSEMQREQLGMDKFTVVGVAPACAGLGYLRSLRQLHCAIISNGMQLNSIMSNVLIDGYGKCGDATSSQHVFDQMEVTDIVSWTSLLVAYTNTNRLDDAYQIFIKTPSRNAVSWTALISGFEQNGQEDAAVGLFEQMVAEGIVPTPLTFASTLSACAALGLVDRGKQVHCYVLRTCSGGADGFNIFIQNALMDMYAKCGDMDSASAMFNKMLERDVVSWNTMVTGFALNGLAKQSLDMLASMLQGGVTPTHVTFLGVLSACGHAGFIAEARQLLRLMEREFGARPRPEHYAAIIDGLGRKNRLVEAMKVIESLISNGGSSGVGLWGALLGACQVHGNVEIGKRAAESLFLLEPENGARYVTLSNIYAAAGKWDEARRLRLVMKGKRLKKDVGCSWIEVKGVKQVFMAEDKSNSRTKEIYEMLDVLVEEIKKEM